MMKLKLFLPITALTFCGAFTVAPMAWAASFLDLSSITTGSLGTFTGTLGGVNVTGFLTGGSNFQILPTGSDFSSSIINNTSLQYSYSSIYTPSQPLGDQVGYGMFGPTNQTATLTINFSSPVTNPVFHIANLDSMIYDFSSTPGIALNLLSGNGGAGDGLTLSGNIIADANPNTIVGFPINQTPPTTGARSAYGSVELLGTFSTLSIGLSRNLLAGQGDGGSFTLSTSAAATPVPEPTTNLGLLALGFLGLGSTLKRDCLRK